MFCCKLGHSIRRKVLSLCYTKQHFVTVQEYPVVLDGQQCKVHVITSTSVDEYAKKYKISYSALHYSREMIYEILFTNLDAPWLWIGAKSLLGDQDMTMSLVPYVVEGNRITLDLLQQEYPCLYDWKYLDRVTLKEIDFPKNGITIQK
jgi:hypothetical protein